MKEPEMPPLPPEPEAVKTLLKEKRRIPRRVIVLTVVLVVAAYSFLATIKHGSAEEHATMTQSAKHAAERRDVTNAEITKAVNKRFGGESKNQTQTALVTRVGEAIASHSAAKNSNVAFKFHLLKEPDSINIYGLSTGDVFITTAMLNRMRTEGELAGALAHAIAHVMAADGLNNVAASAKYSANWQHSAEQEHAADLLTLKLMAQTGYDPKAFGRMLGVLASAYSAGADVSFFITHPNVDGRLDDLDRAIAEMYPNGVLPQFSE